MTKSQEAKTFFWFAFCELNCKILSIPIEKMFFHKHHTWMVFLQCGLNGVSLMSSGGEIISHKHYICESSLWINLWDFKPFDLENPESDTLPLHQLLAWKRLPIYAQTTILLKYVGKHWWSRIIYTFEFSRFFLTNFNKRWCHCFKNVKINACDNFLFYVQQRSINNEETLFRFLGNFIFASVP